MDPFRPNPFAHSVRTGLFLLFVISLLAATPQTLCEDDALTTQVPGKEFDQVRLENNGTPGSVESSTLKTQVRAARATSVNFEVGSTPDVQFSIGFLNEKKESVGSARNNDLLLPEEDKGTRNVQVSNIDSVVDDIEGGTLTHNSESSNTENNVPATIATNGNININASIVEPPKLIHEEKTGTKAVDSTTNKTEESVRDTRETQLDFHNEVNNKFTSQSHTVRTTRQSRSNPPPTGFYDETSNFFSVSSSEETPDLNPPPAGLRDDVNIFDPVEPTPRGKRTIDVLLTGLAEALGYELKPRMHANRKPKTTTPTPPATTAATPPAPKATKVTYPEPTTPKGHKEVDVDFQAQKEEASSEEVEEEDDKPHHAELKDEDGSVDDYLRSTAGNHFRKEYDRIKESERNPHWANHFHDDDKAKYSAPAKRDEEPEQEHFRYYVPQFSNGGETSEALRYFGATVEGPTQEFGKPFSYSFGIPFQEPEPSKQTPPYQGPTAAFEGDSAFYHGPTAHYPGPTAPYEEEHNQAFNIERRRPYEGPTQHHEENAQPFNVEKGRPSDGANISQEENVRPFDVEKGRPHSEIAPKYEGKGKPYVGLRPYPLSGNPSEHASSEDISPTLSHPDHTQAIFSPLQAQPAPKDPKVLNTFQASVSGKLPIISTSKPQMAQILNEMEGNKQVSLWPPPFDYSFDTTDATVVEDQPVHITKHKSVIRTKSSQIVGAPKDWQQAGYLPGDKVLAYASPESSPPLDDTEHPRYGSPTNVEGKSTEESTPDSELKSALRWFPPGRSTTESSGERDSSKSGNRNEESITDESREKHSLGSGESDHYVPRQLSNRPSGDEYITTNGPPANSFSETSQAPYTNARGPPPYSQMYHQNRELPISREEGSSGEKYTSREETYSKVDDSGEINDGPRRHNEGYYVLRGSVDGFGEAYRLADGPSNIHRTPSGNQEEVYVTTLGPLHNSQGYKTEQYPYSLQAKENRGASPEPSASPQGISIHSDTQPTHRSPFESNVEAYRDPTSDSQEYIQNGPSSQEEQLNREAALRNHPLNSAKEYFYVDHPHYGSARPTETYSEEHHNLPPDSPQDYVHPDQLTYVSDKPTQPSRGEQKSHNISPLPYVNNEKPFYGNSQSPDITSEGHRSSDSPQLYVNSQYPEINTSSHPPEKSNSAVQLVHTDKKTSNIPLVPELPSKQVPQDQKQILLPFSYSSGSLHENSDSDDHLYALLSADLATKASAASNPTTSAPINLDEFIKFWQSQSNASQDKGTNLQPASTIAEKQKLYLMMHADLSTKPPSINDFTHLPLDDLLSWFKPTPVSSVAKSEDSKKAEVPPQKPPVQPTETKTTKTQVGTFVGLVIPNPLFVAAGAGVPTDSIASPTSPGVVLKAAASETEFRSYPPRKYVEIVRTRTSPKPQIEEEEEVTARPSEIDEERQPYPQALFVTTESTFYEVKALPTSSPKPFSRKIYPSDNTINHSSPSHDGPATHKSFPYYKKHSSSTSDSVKPYSFYSANEEGVVSSTTPSSFSYKNEEIISTTEKPFRYYENEPEIVTSTPKTFQYYKKDLENYGTSTHKPMYSSFKPKNLALSTTESTFIYHEKEPEKDPSSTKSFQLHVKDRQEYETMNKPQYSFIKTENSFISSTEKPFLYYEQETERDFSTSKPFQSYERDRQEYETTNKPQYSFIKTENPVISSTEIPFSYYRKDEKPVSTTRKLYSSVIRDEPVTTTEKYLFYEQQPQQVIISTIKPFIPPAAHYGIRLPPSTTTTTSTTTTPIPPRAVAVANQLPKNGATPPTGHYGIKLPPPPPPPPPPGYRRRQKNRLSPEEMARRHHIEFLRHAHHPEDYDHHLYEEYPEMESARYLYGDEEEMDEEGEELVVALRSQNNEVSELNASFIRLSESLHPQGKVLEKLESIHFTLSQLPTILDHPKAREDHMETTEISVLLKEISQQLNNFSFSFPGHEVIINKMEAMTIECSKLIEETSFIRKHTEQMKERFENHQQTVESCVTNLAAAKISEAEGVRTVLPTQAERGDEAGESVKNRLEEISSCLSHLMDETSSKDALLLDQNAQVSEIHEMAAQILQRSSERSRGGEDLPSISAALTQLLAKLRIWDSYLKKQEDALNDVNHNMSSAGLKMADGLGAVWESHTELLNNVKELSDKVSMAMANRLGTDNQLALQLLPRIEEWLKLIVSEPLNKNNDLIEDMFRNLEKFLPQLELRRVDDESERMEISGAIDCIKEEIALIQASNAEILSKFEVISNTIDIDSMEYKSQLLDVHNNVLVLKKLQIDCSSGLRKQISDLKPYEFDKDLELIFSTLDKIHSHLVSLTNDITANPELNNVERTLLDFKDSHKSSLNAINKQISAISDSLNAEDNINKLQTEISKMFVCLQRLPELLSSMYDVKLKKDFAEFRSYLKETVAYMKEIVQNDEKRRVDGASVDEESVTAATLALMARDRSLTAGLAALHGVAENMLTELREYLPHIDHKMPTGVVSQVPQTPVEIPVALQASALLEAGDGAQGAAATAAAAAVLLAAHLTEETRRRQSAEAAVVEARRRLESLHSACSRHLEAAPVLQRSARRRTYVTSDTNGQRRSKVCSAKEHRNALRRMRPEVQRSTASSASTEKLVATRRKLRRLRAALRRLEQLSTSMENHYQNMLQELGFWIMQIANLLQAPPTLQALKFPDIPSQIGSWFLQTCSIAEWSVEHLRSVFQQQNNYGLTEKSISVAETYSINKREVPLVPLVTDQNTKSSSNLSSSKKSPIKSGKSSAQKTSLSTSLILSTVQETSGIKSAKTEVVNLSDTSLNGKKSSHNIEAANHSHESDGSYATYTIIKGKTNTSKGGVRSGRVSSDDLSLSLGSLDSVFSPLDTSDAANALASSQSDGAQNGKRSKNRKGQKLAEDKLIAILDGLKDNILNDSKNTTKH